MPNMGSVKLTFKLRNIMPNVKVLILTSRDDAEGIKMAIQAGVNGFLSKKVRKNELNIALKPLLIIVIIIPKPS